MKYRNLGKSGLRVSCLGLGTQGMFGAQLCEEEASCLLSAAFDAGVNLFDASSNSGRAEQTLGNILKKKGWRSDRGLSRKHVLEGLRSALQRLQLDYVDVVFIGPRPGPAHTEELVRALSDAIDVGLALYWGTAGWAPPDVMEAYAVARQFNLVAPVCQWAELPPEPRLFRQIGLGAVTWSPVEPSANEELLPHGPSPNTKVCRRPALKVEELQPVAQRLGCSVTQLAIAWCLRAEGVSSVLLAASDPQLLQQQLQALQVLPLLSPPTLQDLQALLGAA